MMRSSFRDGSKGGLYPVVADSSLGRRSASRTGTRRCGGRSPVRARQLSSNARAPGSADRAADGIGKTRGACRRSPPPCRNARGSRRRTARSALPARAAGCRRSRSRCPRGRRPDRHGRSAHPARRLPSPRRPGSSRRRAQGHERSRGPRSYPGLLYAQGARRDVVTEPGRNVLPSAGWRATQLAATVVEAPGLWTAMKRPPTVSVRRPPIARNSPALPPLGASRVVSSVTPGGSAACRPASAMTFRLGTDGARRRPCARPVRRKSTSRLGSLAVVRTRPV
jgi:hypothetical protein